MKRVRYESVDVQIFTPGSDSWQVVMAGRVIAVDIMWVREQPGHRGKEDNAAAFQVLVARGD